MSRGKKSLLILAAVAVICILSGYYIWNHVDPYVPLFSDNCGQCHGDDLRGTVRGVALIEHDLVGGDSVAELMRSIADGHTRDDAGNVAEQLTLLQIKGLAIYIGERRLGLHFTDFRFDSELVVPSQPISSEEEEFTIEVFADNLDPMPFSIESLPDGSFLLTEKQRGLSIISPTGVQSAYITGTPKTASYSPEVMGVKYGVGWLLDVAIHPDYENNGWIYLHYTDLCPDGCVADSDELFFARSMNRLDRGRIRDGAWVDVETLWRADSKYYSAFPDTGAGGRIAFDDSGHVYLSMGIKDLAGPQDVDNPSGKIHRINDDGTIPRDNPFVVEAGQETAADVFTRQSIWSYGHRSPQGLEWNYLRGRMWSAEMGARGGDEINELLPGRNYGWPFHSLGLDYDGKAIEMHKSLGIEFDINTVEQTLVDITPSPAISSFAFYDGERFPRWKDNILLGSLKGSSLFRLVFDENRLVYRETLIKDLARIRDVEVGYDGLVYLLLENQAGSMIVRLVPVADTAAAALH